jgi:hypothetical protein
MKLDPHPRFPADGGLLIRKLTDLFAQTANVVNRIIDGTENRVFEDGYGVVLKSADGHYWALGVDNAGTVTTTDLGTDRP